MDCKTQKCLPALLVISILGLLKSCSFVEDGSGIPIWHCPFFCKRCLLDWGSSHLFALGSTDFCVFFVPRFRGKFAAQGFFCFYSLQVEYLRCSFIREPIFTPWNERTKITIGRVDRK